MGDPRRHSLLALLAFACAPGAGQVLPERSGLDENRLFDLYIHRRFEHEKARLERLPFDEPRTRVLLGELAVELGVGQILAERESRLKRRLAPNLKHCREEFLRFGQRMHFLQKAADGSVQFLHLKLRDYCSRPRLLELLLGPPPLKAYMIVIVWLARMGRMALPELFGALRSEREELRYGVTRRLVAMERAPRSAVRAGEDPRAVSGVRAALRDEVDEVRWGVVFEMARHPRDTYLSELREALHDRYARVRESAIYALQKLGDRAALPALREALHDDGEFVRAAAATALGHLDGPAAVPYLSAALWDSDPESRAGASAARALGRIGGEAATRALIAYLRGPRSWFTIDLGGGPRVFASSVGDAVAEALEVLGTPEALAAVAAWPGHTPPAAHV